MTQLEDQKEITWTVPFLATVRGVGILIGNTMLKKKLETCILHC